MENMLASPVQIDKKSLTIIVPIGMPGMGKTTYLKVLKNVIENKFSGSLDVISSDKIRKECMDE